MGTGATSCAGVGGDNEESWLGDKNILTIAYPDQ